MSTNENFYQSVLQKLKSRDAWFQSYLTDMTESYTSIYQRNKKLEDENETLRKDSLLYKQLNSEPQVVQSLRESNTDLTRRVTQTYEDLTKAQENLMNKIEEAKNLQEKNHEFTEEIAKLKGKVSSLEKNLKIKEENLIEMGAQITHISTDREVLLVDRDKLSSEVTNLKNENNSLIQRMLNDKQTMLEEWNEIHKERDLAQRKVKELEDAKKKMEEMKKKLLTSGTFSKEFAEEFGLDSVDLKVFYTGQKKEATKVSPLKKLQLHSGEIYSIEGSFTGDSIATCGADGLIKFYDPSRNQPYITLKPQKSNQITTSVCFGFDNDTFASGTADKVVYLWNLSVSRVKATLIGHSDKVSSLCFIRDMSKIVSGSHDRSIKLWDTEKGSISKTILCGSSCNTLLTTADKTRIISGHYDGSARIYSTKTGEMIKSYKSLHNGSITSVCVDLDSNMLLTASKDNTCKLIDLRMERVLSYEFAHANYFNPVEYNKVSFCNYGHSVVAGGSDAKIYIWDSETGKTQHVLEGGNTGTVTGCSYNVSSGHLYTVDNQGCVVVWN